MDRTQRHFRRAAGKILAANGLDRERLRDLPRIADLGLHRRRRGDLLRDQDVLLRLQWSGDEPDRYSCAHHNAHDDTRCPMPHALPPWSAVVAAVLAARTSNGNLCASARGHPNALKNVDS